MDGVDCDWCLVCDKKTNGATYCSEECRHTDLMASSSSSSSASSSASSTGSSYFNTMNNNSHSSSNHNSHNNTLGGNGGVHFPPSCSSSFNDDNYSMMLPLVRKQRTSIPNIYAHCTANPNQSHSPLGAHHFSAPSTQYHSQGLTPPTGTVASQGGSGGQSPGSAAAQYPLFYATLNALRPISPSGPIQDQQR
ncbi:hypothetical protein BGZ83_010392 [Gryganskiella cystojenkinii]|nr:hypothetical protein BGZ83_010392 [Gryganskiella cystojenkinii]